MAYYDSCPHTTKSQRIPKICARPGLTELLDDARSKKFDIVLVFDSSRLARDQRIFWNVVGELKELGIRYVTYVLPDIDSDNDMFPTVGGVTVGMGSTERLIVAAAVADRSHDKVQKIVYVDAFRPEIVREPQGGFDPTREFGPPPQGGNAIPLTEEIIDRIGRDVIGSNRKWMMSMATPWPIKLAIDPITLSENYDEAKETYVFCSLSGDPVDEIIAGKWGKLNGPYKVIETGHWPMITKPEELAKDLVSLAK
jgi:hypothetical protein